MSFAPGIRLDLKQTQGLVLTPQLQQAIRLLQMSNIELASVIDREVAENPFLQHAEAAPRTASDGEPPPVAALPASRGTGSGDEGWRPPPSAPAADHHLVVKRTSSNAFDDTPTAIDGRLTKPRGLRDHLREQLVAAVRSLRLRGIALDLVEFVEDDGYLRDGDDQLAERLRVATAEVAAAREALQACDPSGVGARDLAECLALQLKDKDRFDPAMAALVANLQLLAKADFPELMRRCGIDAEDLQDMIAEIKRLDPKPGLSFAADEPPTLVPDLFVYATRDGRWRVELNNGTLPKVLVDSVYHTELSRETLDRGAKEYLSERLQSANWLAKALDQRARTVLRVAKAIFARQIPFLEAGAQHLRPLVLRDIAEATNLHESTVSRATSEKYVATPHGTFPLKYFFTTAIAATTGDQAHSAEAIRHLIKRMIDRESPSDVLSDDQIVTELKSRGVAIARRTVAKYRESLGIPSSVDRRRAKALGR